MVAYLKDDKVLDHKKLGNLFMMKKINLRCGGT